MESIIADEDFHGEEEDGNEDNVYAEVRITDFMKSLEPFDGDFSDWRCFKVEVFDGILSSCKISDFMKRTLIRSVLKKRPLEIWKHSLAQGKSVEECWFDLIDEYEDPIRIQQYMMEKVSLMKPVRNEEDKEGLKAIMEQVNAFITMFFGEVYEAKAEVMINSIAEKFWQSESKLSDIAIILFDPKNAIYKYSHFDRPPREKLIKAMVRIIKLQNQNIDQQLIDDSEFDELFQDQEPPAQPNKKRKFEKIIRDSFNQSQQILKRHPKVNDIQNTVYKDLNLFIESPTITLTLNKIKKFVNVIKPTSILCEQTFSITNRLSEIDRIIKVSSGGCFKMAIKC